MLTSELSVYISEITVKAHKRANAILRCFETRPRLVGASLCYLILMRFVPWGPGSNLVAHMNRAINDQPVHTAGHYLLLMVQAATNTEHL